jgi:hypothetical protein
MLFLCVYGTLSRVAGDPKASCERTAAACPTAKLLRENKHAACGLPDVGFLITKVFRALFPRKFAIIDVRKPLGFKLSSMVFLTIVSDGYGP